MALAIVHFENNDGQRSRFQVDIGTNRYFGYAIGDGTITQAHGLNILKAPRFISPLIGPLAEERLGRTTLDVPNTQFDRHNRWLQIMSFYTDQRVGPAVSVAIAVPPAGPEVALALEQAMPTQPIETVPFAYQESRPLSSSMFLGAITSLLPSVLPALGRLLPSVLPALGQLIPGLGGILSKLLGGGAAADGAAATPAAGAAGGIAGLLNNPQTVQLLTNLLQSTLGAAKPAAAAPVAAAQSLDLASPSYAHELAVPAAMLTALPSLHPVLSEVLTPGTIESLVASRSPARTIGTLTSALLEFDRANQANHWRLPSFAPDPRSAALLQGLRPGLSQPALTPPYRRVASVRLAFADQTTLLLHGRARLLYESDRDIAFPLTIETPRPIARGTLQLLVKNPATLEVLIEQKYRVEEVGSGPLDVTPRLSRGQLRQLHANEEYLVCMIMVWRNSSGQRIGTSMTQLITLIGPQIFDRLADGGEVMPLNDVEKFRPYWHKVWEGSFDDFRRRIAFDCKYYYTLEPSRSENARMQTVTEMGKGAAVDDPGKLKAGLILSPFQLNALIGAISARPALDQGALAALGAAEFKEQFSHAARSTVKFSGRRGDGVALWVYPEFKLQPIVLKRAAQTNDTGHVLALAEQTVYFPMPATVHWIGVSTGSQ